MYSKTFLKQPLKKKAKDWFPIPIITWCTSKLLQNALLEHSAILSTCIKRQSVFKDVCVSNFEWPLKTALTVLYKYFQMSPHNIIWKSAELLILNYDLFAWVDALCPNQQILSHVGMFPGLHNSASDETRTSSPSILSQALYYRATVLH